MKVNCQDHRKSMELLGLKQRLKNEGMLDKEEKAAIEKRIEILENELGID